MTRLSVDWSDRLKDRLPEEVDDVIALDGKALLHSFSNATDRQPLHLVHAFATGTKVVLARRKSMANQTRSQPLCRFETVKVFWYLRQEVTFNYYLPS